MFLQGENKAKRLELVCIAIDLIVWQIAGISVAMGPGVTSHSLVSTFIVTISLLSRRPKLHGSKRNERRVCTRIFV